LDSSKILTTVLEENDSEECSNYCNDKLDIRGLRKSDCVKEVPLYQESELVAPSDLLVIDICLGDSWILSAILIMSIFQVRALILIIKVIDFFKIILCDISLSKSLFLLLLVILFESLDTHYTHEVISWVRKLWALEANRSEIVY
jgi:hypothetical protein